MSVRQLLGHMDDVYVAAVHLFDGFQLGGDFSVKVAVRQGQGKDETLSNALLADHQSFFMEELQYSNDEYMPEMIVSNKQ